MKIALFMHSETPLLPLANALLKSVTVHAAEALGINSGEISEGKNADMLVLQLDHEPNEQLPVHLLLHRFEITAIHINGEIIKERSC